MEAKFDKKFIVSFITWTSYYIIVILSFDSLGPANMMLGLFPLLVTSWFYGARLGIASGLFMILFQSLILIIMGLTPKEAFTIFFFLGSIIELAVATVVGRLHDVQIQLKEEFNKKVQAEEKFEKAFNINPALMAITRMKDKKFIEINQEFEKVIGYTKKEVIGRTSEELKLFENYSEREKVIKELKEKGSVRNHIVKIKTKIMKTGRDPFQPT